MEATLSIAFDNHTRLLADVTTSKYLTSDANVDGFILNKKGEIKARSGNLLW